MNRHPGPGTGHGIDEHTAEVAPVNKLLDWPLVAFAFGLVLLGLVYATSGDGGTAGAASAPVTEPTGPTVILITPEAK